MPSRPAVLRPRLSTLLFALITFTLSPTLHAQSSTGTFLGEVQDAKGARVQSASVTVSAPSSAFERQTTTNSRGEFRFESLLPGKYQIVVKASGFAEASSDVSVYISSAQDTLVDLATGCSPGDCQRHRPSFFDHHRAAEYHQRRNGWRGDQHRHPEHSAGRAQLRQHRLPGAGHRAGRAVRSDQGPHHRGFVRRQLGIERHAHCRWRRQFRRLHWRLPAELFSRRAAGVCRSDLAAECRRGPHHRRRGRNQHQERHQPVARRFRCFRARLRLERALSHRESCA